MYNAAQLEDTRRIVRDLAAGAAVLSSVDTASKDGGVHTDLLAILVCNGLISVDGLVLAVHKYRRAV